MSLCHSSEDTLYVRKQLFLDFAKGGLIAVCSYVDEVQWHYHYSSALHYLDTPNFKCNYDYYNKFMLLVLLFGLNILLANY